MSGRRRSTRISNKKELHEIPSNDAEKPSEDQASFSATTGNKKKLSTFVLRALSASLMGAFCIGLIQAGHVAVLVAGILVQVECFREMVNVRYFGGGDAMPLFRTLQWGYFFTAMLFTHGASIDEWVNEQDELASMARYTKYAPSFSFASYCVVMMVTVMTFKKAILELQFQQLMWTLLSLCLVVFQFKFFTTNVLHGLFWWAYPALLVIANDISAYLVGKSYGGHFFKSTFWELSPNKTWEGFIGAGVFTMVVGFVLPLYIGRMPWFYCPAQVHALEGLSLFPEEPQCITPSVFIDTEYELPEFLQATTGRHSMTLMPMQLHGLLYGCFASVVAPFGGFLASAIKRAYKIKDFENFLPGHGGIMDRMDCQLVMIVFTYLHFNTFVAADVTVAERIFHRVMNLDPDAQQAILSRLTNALSVT